MWGGDKPPERTGVGVCGGGVIGGYAAVNLDVTDGKAVADHYHKSDKR